MISCGPEASESAGSPIGEADQPLYPLTTKLWTTPHIPVCWHDQPGLPSFSVEKNQVKAVLTGKRSWSSAGNLDFTGFVQGCGNTPTGIKISIGQNSGAATSYLGLSTNGVAEMMLDFGSNVTTNYPICSSQGLSREQCIKVIALHEFGHAIGLAHEHNRPDTPEWCLEQQSPQGTNGNETFGPWDNNSIMNYCSTVKDISGLERRGIEKYYGQYNGDTQRHRDTNLDGKADLFCHDVTLGQLSVDRADASGTFGGTDWVRTSTWCAGSTKRVFKGDFNVDGRIDLLCHDAKTGHKQIDFASTSGQYAGNDWSTTTAWCNGDKDRLMIGDFNNDNRDDLLCRNVLNGNVSIDYASTAGNFGGTEWTGSGVGCTGFGKQYMGDLNGDGRDDLLCHYPEGLSHLGQGFTRSLADGSGRFTTSVFVNTGFCSEPSSELVLGRFNGDGRWDLMCHDVESGLYEIQYSGTGGTIGGSGTWSAQGGCSFVGARLSVGDFSGDGRDDILCFDAFHGTKFIAYANASGAFFTTPDWSSFSNWCSWEPSELH